MTSAAMPMTTATPMRHVSAQARSPAPPPAMHEQGDVDEMRREEARQAAEEGAVAVARQEGVAGGTQRKRGEQQQWAVFDDDQHGEQSDGERLHRASLPGSAWC